MPEDTNYWNQKYWPRVLRRRLSRRRLIQLSAIGAVGAATAAAIGCGDGGPAPGATATAPTGGTPTPPPGVSAVLDEYRTKYRYSKLAELARAAGDPKTGGTYHFSHYQGFTGAWDLTGPEGDALASYAPNHYNGLVTFAMDDFADAHNSYTVIGDLAKEWEVADDGLTVTFHLNEGVKFHDIPPVNGREMTSEDVKYCVDVYKTAVAQSPIFADVASVDTPDKYTAVFKFSKPAAYFLQSLVYPVSLIFAREAFEDKDVFSKTPIGTGPFVLEKWDPPNVYSAKKNPTYFKKDPTTGLQLPYLDGFEAPILNIQPTLEEPAFRAGEIDTIWNHFKTNFDDILASFPDNVGQVTTPPPGYQPHIALKLDKPPLDNPQVRQALQQLIDTSALIEGVAQGLADPGIAHDFSFFGREFPWTLDELIALGGNHEYDPAKAQQLLDAAGGFGRPLKFLFPIADPLQYEVFKTIVSFWQQGGIEVITDEVPITDIARFNAAFFGKEWGDFDAIGFGFAGPGMDEDQYCYGPLNSKSLRNFYWVNDPQLDDLTERQRRAFDQEERQGIVLDIIKRELSQSYRIWGVLPYKLAVRRGYAYNVVDTIHAWGNIGWGSKSNEEVWLNKA
jgi:peptide/nickel transport system substrate-binding protein